MSSNWYFKTDTGIEKEVSFFTIETWGKLAELVYEKGKKGRGVRAVGRLRQERWTDQDGKQRERIAIVSEHVEFRPEFKVGSDQVDDDQYQSVAEETAEEKPKRKSTKKAEETAEEKPKKRQPKKQKA
jgi:single-strand DNA-binding protein